VVSITTTKAELFAIKCGINQATAISSISNIVIFTNSIHAARRIFDSLSHPFQIYIAAISVSLGISLPKIFIINQILGMS